MHYYCSLILTNTQQLQYHGLDLTAGTHRTILFCCALCNLVVELVFFSSQGIKLNALRRKLQASKLGKGIIFCWIMMMIMVVVVVMQVRKTFLRNKNSFEFLGILPVCTGAGTKRKLNEMGFKSIAHRLPIHYV